MPNRFEPSFKDYSTVDLIQQAGGDAGVVRAARVSVHGAGDDVTSATPGLIRHMMKNRHGSVFEHNTFTFRVETPLFVAREFMRHRIGWSYNELSGRYAELDGTFWLPPFNRKLRQIGKPAEYRLVPGDLADELLATGTLRETCTDAYTAYRNLLNRGIAREVARTLLPVSVYTSFYATCNARSLMSFLSLRIDSHANAVATHPLQEIQEVAGIMSGYFAEAMPLTWAAFEENGRIAP